MKIEINFKDLDYLRLRFSNDKQKIKTIEELSELQKEICKELNLSNNFNQKINVKESIKEEISDSLLMIFQLIVIYNFDISEIQSIIENKLLRTFTKFNIKRSNLHYE